MSLGVSWCFLGVGLFMRASPEHDHLSFFQLSLQCLHIMIFAIDYDYIIIIQMSIPDVSLTTDRDQH
jgi:hypothetical protein